MHCQIFFDRQKMQDMIEYALRSCEKIVGHMF